MVNDITTSMMNLKFALVPNHDSTLTPYRRAVLPIPGSNPISIVIMSDQSSCEKLSSRLFMVKLAEVDVAMVEDTLRELANITAGQVKRAMSIDQALGLPKILIGSEPWSTASSHSQCITLRSTDEDVDLEVQISKH